MEGNLSEFMRNFSLYAKTLGIRCIDVDMNINNKKIYIYIFILKKYNFILKKFDLAGQ